MPTFPVERGKGIQRRVPSPPPAESGTNRLGAGGGEIISGGLLVGTAHFDRITRDGHRHGNFTGQALQTAARDDADLVLVHDPEAEEKFIAAGDGIDRRQIAWNDFVVVGPRSDPAHLAGGHDAITGLRAIAEARAPFVSRGDKSGTDALEKRLWRAAGIAPAEAGA